ncbi:TonB-dependent receptor domain-containing protein [Nitratireductor soli]|uniref:TonB-dependent receptor domain-containing protein n=1 Tax=Nitratireductor soli TaxID=1670619 RepID=UPI00065E1C94|nr:TonB-dependent receptor [Nitratireductor soli]
MALASCRPLAFGTALALLCQCGIALAQEQAADAQEGATLLPRLDVGAGAESTAGTDVLAVTPQDMQRKKPADLREVFSGEPQIAVGGAIPGTQKIYVNGVDETNLAVTVDGSRQNNKVFHHNGTYLLDPALLKAVTVQAGVAPADAGPAALGGSIGFETKDATDLLEPGRNFGGFVTGAWDTNSETFVTGASVYGMQDGFEYLGYLNFGKGGNFTAGNGEEMLGTGTNLLSGLGKIAYETLDGNRFELSHEQVRDDALRPYRANAYINIRNEPILRNYELNRQNTVFTYTDTAPEGWLDPKVVIAYSRTRVETPVFDRATGEIIAPAIGETSSLNGKVENKFAVDLGSVTAGFDFYSDRAKLAYDAVPPEFPHERASNVGAYAQARLEPFDRARISFGGRLDHQWFTGVDGTDFSNAGVSGNVSGEYDIVPDFLTAKAGVSHVWGGIPLAENFIQNPAWTYDGDPDPVTANNYTAGLEARFAGLTLEANIFQSDISNARFPNAGNALRNFDLRSRGWEVGAGYEWDAGFVSVKYADIRADVGGVTADSEVGRYLTTPLGQIIMIGGGYTFHDWGLKVGGDVEIALKYDATLTRHPNEPASPKRALPGYQVVNAFVEYTPPSHKNFTLRADVRNLFDETYTSRASYGQDFDGVKPHYAPGRSFRLSATMRF